MTNQRRNVVVVGAGSGIGAANTVSPGPVETPMLPDFEQSMGKQLLDTVRATVGRHAGIEDIVPVIDFLGSPAAGWITGQDVLVDGGFINAITAGTPVP